MTRLYMALGAFAIVGGLLAALWWQIDRNAALRASLASCKDTITKSEQFNEGASNPDGRDWRDRLRGSAAD